MINPKRTLKVFLVFILISLLVGCKVLGSPDNKQREPDFSPTTTPEEQGTNSEISESPNESQSEPDYWPTTGWRTSTPEEQGMDSEILAEMFEFILEKNYNIHSVTVIRNGYLVADATFFPFHPGSLHQLHSCTKSITSVLIGIAIKQGYIESVQQPVLSFFPERSAANLDDNKEKMTLEHLLTMSSGLDCKDSYVHDWQGLDLMMQTNDWVQYMLDLPMADPPGTRFEYCNGASLLLSAIIQETTGMNASLFAEENLFIPLGIDDVVWPSNPQGITIGWGGLYMKPHDMAKIGYLYLNGGCWEDNQIISADWVAASIQKHITGYFDVVDTVIDEYGYQWWVNIDRIYYYAAGYGEQYIFVFPEYEMVVVFTSDLDMNRFRLPIYLLEDIILAAQSSTPLPPNPDGLELLNSVIQRAALDQTEPEPVPPLPEIAEIVSGQTFIMDPNPLGFQSVSLTFPGEAEALFTWSSLEFIWEEVPVGLDNIYRFSPGPYGIPWGWKGWWESDKSFATQTDSVDGTGRGRLKFTFEGEQIIMELSPPISGISKLTGRLEE